MSIIQGPLIQPNINNDNNTTRLMKVDTAYATIITDGIANIENGYISDLNAPTANNEIATKEYVDNSGGGSGGASGPNESIQYNSAGLFAGSANLTLSNPGLVSAILNINGVLTNNTITMSGSQISGLSNPVLSNQAATKNYVDGLGSSLSVITIKLQISVDTIYTPVQVYNTIANIEFDPDNIFSLCATDSMPSAVDMATFLGSEFIVGKSWLTVFRAPQQSNTLFMRMIKGVSSSGCIFSPITYLTCNNSISQTILSNYYVSTVLSVVTNSTPGFEQYYSYVISDVADVTQGAQITGEGVLTPSYGDSSLFGTGSIIYPIPANPTINGVGAIAYTYANLKQFFIIRTGLTGPTSDTFVSAAIFTTSLDFTMGGGTFKFFIQNPTAFDLTLLPSVGWSFQSGNSNVIPAGYCGAFWVTVIISPASCTVHTIGINPING